MPAAGRVFAYLLWLTKVKASFCQGTNPTSLSSLTFSLSPQELVLGEIPMWVSTKFTKQNIFCSLFGLRSWEGVCHNTLFDFLRNLISARVLAFNWKLPPPPLLPSIWKSFFQRITKNISIRYKDEIILCWKKCRQRCCYLMLILGIFRQKKWNRLHFVAGTQDCWKAGEMERVWIKKQIPRKLSALWMHTFITSKPKSQNCRLKLF